MLEKLSDCRRDEEKLRKERNSLRKELETKNVYGSIMKKLTSKVQRIRNDIKARNKNKISRNREEKDCEDLAVLSSLQEQMGEFGELKIFKGISSQPEDRKPPT